MLGQIQNVHPVAYASISLSCMEANYNNMTKVEILAIIWVMTYLHTYLFDHAAANCNHKSHSSEVVLETPNPIGEQGRWWSKIYGWKIKEVKIIHCSGKAHLAMDVLSCNPQAQREVQILQIISKDLSISEVLDATLDPELATE